MKTKTKTKILNLTQHAPTLEQTEAGVTASLKEVITLLTFEVLPSEAEVRARASAIAAIAEDSGAQSAMIGGAPFLMSALENALISSGIQPLYAFSTRVNVETTDANGYVTKTNVFKHLGFIKVRG